MIYPVRVHGSNSLLQQITMIDFLRKATIALVAATLANPILAQNTTIQIGFLEPLNYPFVLGNPDAASQIAQDLSPAIAYGLNLGRLFPQPW